MKSQVKKKKIKKKDLPGDVKRNEANIMPVLKTAYKYSRGTNLSVIYHCIPNVFDFPNHHPKRSD